MRLNVIQDRQVAVLQKMFIYSINHLDDDEKRLFEQVVEGLKDRRKQRAADAEEQVSARQISAMEEAKVPADMALCTPEQVVRCYVSCWNSGKFEMEFECLADSFAKSLHPHESREEYVRERALRYANRKNIGIISKELIEVSSAEIHGNHAVITTMERHQRACGDKCLVFREYALLKEPKGWKIQNYENKKSVAG